MLYIASDHAGFQLKEDLDDYLETLGQKIEDLGPYEMDPKDDYPDFALALAKKVAGEEDSIGILSLRNSARECVWRRTKLKVYAPFLLLMNLLLVTQKSMMMRIFYA